MPVIACPGGKWRIGSGKCVFNSKKDAEKAMIAMFAHRESQRDMMFIAGITDKMLDKMIKEEKNGK